MHSFTLSVCKLRSLFCQMTFQPSGLCTFKSPKVMSEAFSGGFSLGESKRILALQLCSFTQMSHLLSKLLRIVCLHITIQPCRLCASTLNIETSILYTPCRTFHIILSLRIWTLVKRWTLFDIFFLLNTFIIENLLILYRESPWRGITPLSLTIISHGAVLQPMLFTNVTNACTNKIAFFFLFWQGARYRCKSWISHRQT